MYKMGTSKAPKTTRTVPASTSADDEHEKEEIQLPDVPEHWEFNDLLVNIGNAMTHEDLEEIKARFKGPKGLGRRLLSEIKTAPELFDWLQKNNFLDTNNLLVLQAVLFKLGRMDLYDKAVVYAQSLGDVVHFSPPPKEPTNGYQFMQFHIEGKDFSKVKRSSLDAMRMVAARFMIVPPECVIIAGIEPSSSILVTLMVPEMFITYFEAALSKDVAVKELTDLGIDIIRMGDKVVNIHGIEEVDIIETEQQSKLRTIYEQLESTKEKLEDRDIECLQLKRKLQEKDRHQNNIDSRARAWLIKMVYESFREQKVPRLSKQSAFVFFKHALTLVKLRNYDKDIIAMLLDAQTAVLSARVRDAQEIQVKLLFVENQRLKDALFQFQIANARLQILSAFDSQEFQRKFLENVKAILLGQGIGVSQKIEFNQVIFQILKVISELLRPEDRKSLLRVYTWPEQDDLTQHLKIYENDLLAVLVAKETSQTGRLVDLNEFILGKLTDVKREDLKIIFTQMVSTYKTDYTYVPSASGSNVQQEAKSGKQQSKPSKHQTKPGKQHPPKSTGQPHEVKTTLEDQVADLLKKVNNIEGMMQASQAAYKSSTFGPDILQPNLFPQFKLDPRTSFGMYGTSEDSKGQ